MFQLLLKMCIKEHKKAIPTLYKNSLLAQHHMLHQHKIDIEGVKINIPISSSQKSQLAEKLNLSRIKQYTFQAVLPQPGCK